jgi:hydrocephalus-inducing protein
VARPLLPLQISSRPSRPSHQVDCGSVVLQPGEARDLTVTFRPTATQAYRETIPLQINGLYTVNIIITGDHLIVTLPHIVLSSVGAMKSYLTEAAITHYSSPSTQPTRHTKHKTGEGVPLRVELSDPSQRTLAFGPVPRGQSSSRVLAVVNRGRAAAALSLAPAQELFARLGIEALPAAPVTLRPKEEARITLFFR